ncbi:trypsin-like cysteine/serine peptidase domain-containing protein [Dactylonectria macrodidyma]|uniref:Trypsin-like cysteine/serine peptidase domain-containing protein n=1 Tax=Dactylonectria macrodidyma TaxID=307937 RepID=A0A9P9EPI0_9HYPO|nr:trypsin-like cysteine/serine peptidase domain-containing protein [Dactylonectria macrodidyma]
MAEVIDLTADTPPPRRQTRSATRAKSQQAPTSQPSTASQLPPPNVLPVPWALRNPPSRDAGFRRKRAWLQTHSVAVPADLRRRHPDVDPVAATLVFAQEEAGTAVCISPDGVVLTCAHCVAETPADLDLNTLHALLFASGRAVSARTVAWDPVRDLALLVIAEAEAEAEESRRPFPFMRLATSPPKHGARLLCVGHPGSEDLEAAAPGRPTGYDTLVLSAGRFRGLSPGQDPQDNSEVGALAHDCWTYWGHSGAGLVEARTGELVGLHSSWDDETGLRRGVPWEAVDEFVREMELKQRDGMGVSEGWRWCVREGMRS